MFQESSWINNHCGIEKWLFKCLSQTKLWLPVTSCKDHLLILLLSLVLALDKDINLFLLEPSAPIGFEASYLSESSIKLEWRAPDYPNGDIIEYKIYWRRTRYSFWKDQQHVDWCKRDVKVDKMSSIEIDTKRGLLNGTALLRGIFRFCFSNFSIF